MERDVGGRGGFSVTYGVNSRSILTELAYFDITKFLPFDIMHTLFEGVAPHLLKQLLKYVVDEGKFLTVEQLNSCVTAPCTGYSEKDTVPSRVYRDGGSGSDFHFRQKVLAFTCVCHTCACHTLQVCLGVCVSFHSTVHLVYIGNLAHSFTDENTCQNSASGNWRTHSCG